MKLEEKIKQKYLYSSNLNFFKICYFYIQYWKSLIKLKKPNSNWGVDLKINNIFKKKKERFLY